MNFVFLTRTKPFLGTYRIWFNDLSLALSDLGCTTVINPTTLPKQIDYFIVTPEQPISDLKTTYPYARIGVLKPQYFNHAPYNKLLKYLDFLVAGSRFESDFLLTLGLPIITLQHVETIPKNMCKSFTEKQFDESNPAIIGYHGNRQHLEQLGGYIGKALEIVHEQFPINLHAIYNISAFGNWTVGRPSIPIVDIQWDYNSYLSKLAVCDIGIVPNISPTTRLQRFLGVANNTILSGQWLGSHPDDVFFRMKRTSNAGRAFVFAQLGIPVVGCPNPEMLETLVPAGCVIPAATKEAWVVALRKLLDNHSLRRKMSEKAFAWASTNLCITTEAQKLLTFLQQLPDSRHTGAL